jgi:hypothetical protein
MRPLQRLPAFHRPGSPEPRPRHGQALVETVLALTLLLSAVIGVVEIGLYAIAHQVIVSAAQEGARVASAEGRTLTEGRRQAAALLDFGPGVRADRFAITPRCDAVVDDVCQGQLVAMRIAGAYPLLILGGAGLAIPVDVEIRMFVEGAGRR